MASPPPPGIYVPVPTFFAPDSKHPGATELDAETQGAHAVYLARAGVRGLVVLGSTGEAVHVAARERRGLLRGVRASLDGAGFGAVPVIAGTAGANVEETVGQLIEAGEAGARWGLCLAPGFNAAATAQEGIVAWFTAVADRSPIPILVYHYPGVSNGLDVSPATLVALSKHANIVGCKLSHGDLSHLAQVALDPAVDRARFRVFTGLGQVLAPATAAGCAGAVDGSANFFPRALVRLHELCSRRDEVELEERARLQFRVSAMEELLVRHGLVAVKEAVYRLRGFGHPTAVRPPLARGLPGGEAEWAHWGRVLGAMEEVESALADG